MVIVSDQRMGPQVERGRTTPDVQQMLDPHNTHGAMPTRCPSYFGVGLRRVSAPACARRGTTAPSIPPGSSGLLPPTDAKVWPIPSSILWHQSAGEIGRAHV